MELLRTLLRRRIALALASAVLIVLSVSAALWWNDRLRVVIDAISERQGVSGGQMLSACGALFCVAALSYGLRLLSGWTCETLAHDIRVGYARHFTRLSVEEVETVNAGEQLSRLQNEIGSIGDSLRDNLFSICESAVRFFGTLFWLLLLDARLTVIAHLPLLFLVWYVAHSSKVIEAAARKSREAQGRMNGYADTLLSLFPVIRLYDAAGLVLKGYSRELKDWETASIREERTRAALMSLSALLSCVPLLLLLLVGGGMTVDGRITLGALYIFINLSGNVSGAMMNMPGYIAAFRRFTADMERVEPYIELAEEKGRRA